MKNTGGGDDNMEDATLPGSLFIRSTRLKSSFDSGGVIDDGSACER